jgi:hypothetical protein
MDSAGAESLLDLAEQARARITGPNGNGSLEQLEQRSA